MSYQRNAIGLNNETVTASSMARQAIINGNFDIWQRGTSLASLTDATITFLADRWGLYGYKHAGTPPTIATSRQELTTGDIPGAFYFFRWNVDGAGSSLGTSSRHYMYQSIEHGTRYLCGASKSITVSFWARSSISDKRLGIFAMQAYGTGGSPSSSDVLTGATVELTSDWAKYTVTIDTATLSGKTFGTSNNDYLQIRFNHQWGSYYNTYLNTDTAEATFGGSGNIDIAQVQLCAGDVALPFEPKSYDAELQDCLRYFWRCGNTGAVSAFNGYRISTKYIYNVLNYPTPMRTTPTLTSSSPSWNTADPSGNEISAVNVSTTLFVVATGAISYSIAKSMAHSTELTITAATSFDGSSGVPVELRLGSTAYLDFSAEL